MHALSQAGIDQVPNTLTITRQFSPTELSLPEASLVIKIAAILSEEYALWEVPVVLATISHGAQSVVRKDASGLSIFLERSSPALAPLIECYRNTPDVFTGFVRDYVRTNLYSQIAQYVPSATREGAEALQRQLRRNRELYRYEYEDFGAIDAVVSDYIAGKATLEEVFQASTTVHRSSVLRVDKAAVGRVEDEIADIVDSPATPAEPTQEAFQPAPPILRRETETPSKVLTVHADVAPLNNFRLFLSLSEKVFQREQDFFLFPHATRVIWGGHRVIYIFSQASGALTGYYDIELREALEMPAAGKTLPTTTIISKNRIYIPVPGELVPAFEISSGAKEFFVRFDYVPG